MYLDLRDDRSNSFHSAQPDATARVSRQASRGAGIANTIGRGSHPVTKHIAAGRISSSPIAIAPNA